MYKIILFSQPDYILWREVGKELPAPVKGKKILTSGQLSAII